MAMDKNYEILLNASLERYEKMIEKGAVDSEEFSASKLSKIENKINLLVQDSEVKANFLERLNKIRTYIPVDVVAEENTTKNISEVSPRFFKVPTDFIKKHKKETVAAIIGALGLTAFTLHGCGKEASTEPVVVEATETTEKAVETPVETEAKEEFTKMDSEYVELSESITKGLNDEISKGLEVTEENKNVVSKAYTEYYVLNQMDTLTDEQWANIFPNSNVTSDDIMQAKYDFEFVDEKRVTVSSNYLDYSLIFNEADSKMLNNASVALDKVKNATTAVEKKQANSEFMDCITDVFNLESDNQITPYSFRAIDTFRNVYFNAFDELTLHKVINDELEHKVDTASLCNISENGLNVEEKSISSIQSKVVIATQEKIDTRLQNGWNYANTHELNPYNDIDDIVEYVENHIDLSLYQELPDYEEYLTKITLSPSTKSKDDSGISDGKGGHISKTDMQAHGVNPSDPNAKEKYEQTVRDEDAKKSEESKVISDNDGNTISSGENASEQDAVDNYESEYNKGYEAGSKAYENGGSNTAPDGSSSAYKEGYSNGWNDAKKRNESNQTTYVPTDNGDTTTTESTETVDDYKPDTKIPTNDNTNNNTTTEFVPIDNGDTTTTESTETVEDYTTDYVPVDESTTTIESTETIEDYTTEYEPIEDTNQTTTIESSETEEGYSTEFVPVEASEMQNVEESSEIVEEYMEESKGQSNDDVSSQLESLKQLRDLILNDTNEVVENKGMKI